MSRTFTVKSVNGRSEEVVAEEAETLNEFSEKIRLEFGIDSDRTIKLIHRSSIVNDDQTFSQIPDKSTIICMATRPPRPSQPTAQPPDQTPDQPVEPDQPAQPVQQPVQSTQHPLLPPSWEIPASQTNRVNAQQNTHPMFRPLNPSPETEEKYSFMNIKAYTVVFLNFIASNPQLRNLFMNNYGALVTEIVKNPDLESVMKSILSQSSQIAKSMETGENIKVNINMDGEQPSMERIELTEQDQQNIEQLIAMGFNPDKAVVEYLKAGKDINRALDALQQ